MWTNEQLQLLIDERKVRNVEYHDIVGSSRVDFWNSIADKINKRFRTRYIDHIPISQNYEIRISRYVSIWLETDQVEEQELLRNILMNFVPAFGKDQVGLHLYVLETQFDQIHNANTSARRREENRRSRTPPPSYEEVSSMLDRREVSARHRGRSMSPTGGSNNSNVNQGIGGASTAETNRQNPEPRAPTSTENNPDNDGANNETNATGNSDNMSIAD